MAAGVLHTSHSTRTWQRRAPNLGGVRMPPSCLIPKMGITVLHSPSFSIQTLGETLRKFSLLVLVSFALGSVLVAQNAPLSKLKGDFPFNETLHIVEQPAVGGVCGATLSGPVSMVIYNDTGIWSFDGKGNIHMTDSGMFINVVPPTDASQVTPAAATCSGTYAMLDEST